MAVALGIRKSRGRVLFIPGENPKGHYTEKGDDNNNITDQ